MGWLRRIGFLRILNVALAVAACLMVLLLVDSVKSYTLFRQKKAVIQIEDSGRAARVYQPQHIPEPNRVPAQRLNLFQPGARGGSARNPAARKSSRASRRILGVVRRDVLYLVVAVEGGKKTRLVGVGERLENGDEVMDLLPDRVILRGKDGQTTTRRIFSYQEAVRQEKRKR